MAVEYAIYGLRVRSDLQLDAEVSDEKTCDLVLDLVPETVRAESAPAGKVLAEHADRDRGFWVVETAKGYSLGIRGVLEARIAADFTRVELARAAAASEESLSTFAQGAVLASVLTLRGACVLHASAVELSGKALAFVGLSGSGKSMLAALCCAAGCRLLTDDLLVVEKAGGALSALRGTTRLRLRQSAADLVGLLAAPARVTVDERFAVPAAVAAPKVPLAAILLPERTTDRLDIARLAPARAAFSVIRAPRIPGWRDERILGAQLRHAAELARSVPAFALRVPATNRTPDALREVLQGVLCGAAGPDAPVQEAKPA
jgi:hypothetical protein